MDQNARKIGLINWVALLGVTVGLLVISNFVSSAAGMMGAIISGLGFLVAILSYFQMGLEERERLEELELEELNKSHGTGSLFETADEDTFPARRSRQLFERYFVPVFTSILFLLQAAAVYWPWKHFGTRTVAVDRATLAMALLGLFGVVLTLLGKYSSGLARLQGQRLLGAGANYALLTAYSCFVIAASLGAVLAGFPKVDHIVAQVLCVVLGFIALETLLGLIMEIYRVRVKGRETRVLYESRLVGLLGKPEAILSTAAHALDYQFGFKVSETWFYRFLERALPILILAQVGLLLFSTCFVYIEPGEQGLMTRMGAFKAVLDPGLHVKLPWGVDDVKRYRTSAIQTFEVGSEGGEEEHVGTITWTKAHSGKEDNLLVATRQDTNSISVTDTNHVTPPVNLISVGIPVQYQITNLYSWAYVNQKPEALLKNLASREVVRYLASADLNELTAHGREVAGRVLCERIQEAANQQNLGTKIIFAGVEDIHPPVKVAQEYEKVIGEMHSKQSKILSAQAYAVQTNAMAGAMAAKVKCEADAEQAKLTKNAEGRVAFFTNQLQAFNAAPQVYTQRAYYQTVARSVQNARKYVIATTNINEVVQLNLEDKLKLDMGDMVMPAKKEEKPAFK